jgi:hypothetical protein
LPDRVARWFVFKPKIQIWVNFEGLAMEDVGIFYGHLVHFMAFWYILWTFGIVRGNLIFIFPVLVFCTKKNLATLLPEAVFATTKPVRLIFILKSVTKCDLLCRCEMYEDFRWVFTSAITPLGPILQNSISAENSAANFHPQILDKFSPKNNCTCMNK